MRIAEQSHSERSRRAQNDNKGPQSAFHNLQLTNCLSRDIVQNFEVRERMPQEMTKTRVRRAKVDKDRLLARLRRRIDLQDKEIVDLVNKRARIVKEIGKLKRTASCPIYDPNREQEVYQKIRRHNRGPLPDQALEAIYRELMSGSLALEKTIQVSYLGPPGTFTHMAALSKFGSSVTYVPVEDIEGIFVEAARGHVDYAVVPVENSTDGAVTDTLDMFTKYDVSICAELTLRVHHHLLSRFPREEIRRIYSRPQVFGQCRNWLASNMPHRERLEVASTTRAAQLAGEEDGSAAIASAEAAEVYGLPIVCRSIEDSPSNVTRFLVIGKHLARPTKNDKTSIMFSIKDRVGALYDMLLPFKNHGINLTRIESRPSLRKAWDYYFFVDFLGHVDAVEVKKALGELEKRCTYLKVLGSFPRA